MIKKMTGLMPLIVAMTLVCFIQGFQNRSRLSQTSQTRGRKAWTSQTTQTPRTEKQHGAEKSNSSVEKPNLSSHQAEEQNPSSYEIVELNDSSTKAKEPFIFQHELISSSTTVFFREYSCPEKSTSINTDGIESVRSHVSVRTSLDCAHRCSDNELCTSFFFQHPFCLLNVGTDSYCIENTSLYSKKHHCQGKKCK